MMVRLESRGARRGVFLLGLGALFLGIVIVPAPVQAEVHTGEDLFVARKTDCLAPGFEELACGGLGSFYVGTGEDCGQSKIDLSGSGLYLRTPVDDRLVASTSNEAWSPCLGGRCFSDDPRRPWVAVIDWSDGHGRSVGETVRQASGQAVDVRLFALEASGLDVIDHLPAVNDAQVLAQLCRVAEEAAARPPLAVNMSFGRLDRASCEAAGRGLYCELGRVIDHLRHHLRIPVFAAAGHEGLLLYPAADPGVVAVGAVDLAHLAATGRARPLPQTPPGVDALFAGQGLYLAELGGTGIWAAPHGSSYASALAAGWWAAYRLRAPELADKLLGFCTGTLAPRVDGGRVYLACGSMTLPGSGLAGPDVLIQTAVGARPEVCGGELPADGLLLEVAGPLAEVPRLTLAEVQAHLSRPAPDSRPCVPCHGSGGGGDNGGGGSAGTGTIGDGPGPLAPRAMSDSVLTVDLSASRGVPGELELLGIYLQVGRRVFRFSDSENPTLLGELALGSVERLTLSRLPRRPGVPLAFVFSLRLRAGGLAFRTTTPILVHEHRKEF